MEVVVVLVVVVVVVLVAVVPDGSGGGAGGGGGKHLPQHKIATPRFSKPALCCVSFYVRRVRQHVCLQRNPTCNCQTMTDTTKLACKGAQHKMATNIRKAAMCFGHVLLGAVASACPT